MTVLARNAGDVAELQRSATARLARLRHTAVSAKR
jgi:hypothetical protein